VHPADKPPPAARFETCDRSTANFELAACLIAQLRFITAIGELQELRRFSRVKIPQRGHSLK
jgi:hypothetical protein